MTNIEKGIKLRSGKILPRESYYDDSDYFCYSPGDGYLVDEEIERAGGEELPYDPYEDYLVDEEIERAGLSYEEESSPKSDETVTESIEKKVSCEIQVPNGFGEVAGDYLEKLNRSYQDCRIDYNQLNEMVNKFADYLNWFPDDVPQKKIKKFCREAYAHTLWKAFLDEKITRRQFVSLMGGRPKFFPKK